MGARQSSAVAAAAAATSTSYETSDAAVGEVAPPHPGIAQPLLSVAPMMDWTDVHFRQMARILSRRTVLWTEMVVDKTILYNEDNLDKWLWHPEDQSPVVLQLGGSDTESLAGAVKRMLASGYHYDEINLNCGCPSDRVAGSGCFGAAMMLQPQLVADCTRALGDAVPAGIPVTVKCRLGVDDVDSYEELCNFIKVVSEGSSVKHFIMHSRKCLLNGLSPHQNRTIPPLYHEWVWAAKRDFPHLDFSLNGGIQSPAAARAALDLDIQGQRIHGVMIGRAAFYDPWGVLGNADAAVYGEPNPCGNRKEVLERYCKYADRVVGFYGTRQDGQPSPSVRQVIKPLLNLFYNERNNKKWKTAIDKRLLSHKHIDKSVREVLDSVMHLIPEEVLMSPPGANVIEEGGFHLDSMPDVALPGPASRAGASPEAVGEPQLA